MILRFISYGFTVDLIILIICFPWASGMMHSFSFKTFDRLDYIVEWLCCNDPSRCLWYAILFSHFIMLPLTF